MSANSESSPYKIFITYRREDSQDTCGFLYYRLKERFGRDAVFKDVDSIPAGYSFPGYINHVLGQCRIVLVVMGPSWPTVVEKDGAHAGQLRLNDPEDRVRIEVERALALSPVDDAGRPTSDLLLIPLLVQGLTRMPDKSQLPASLHPLTERNARQIRRDPDFEHDVQQLIGVIASWMGVSAPLPATPADPISDLLTRFLPQIRAAYDTQDWPQVARLAAFIQRSVPADRLPAVPTEVYTMQGRALMADRDYAGAKVAWDTVRARDPLDVSALRAAADARIALGERAAALPLVNDALTLTSDRAQRLPLLRIYASVLIEVAHGESGAAATTHWNEMLRAANEGLRLAGEQDAGWLMIKLEALSGLGRDTEALEATRALTTRPDANAARWLTRARLAWKLAGETPTDEVRQSLDAASHLAPQDAAIITARQELLVILKPDRFPVRLAELGFTAQKRAGVAYITSPVCAVPAGEFLMGSDKRRDPQAGDSELPQSRIMVAAFSIGRFPVTVAEYACFVEARQHRQPQQWPSQMQKLDHPVISVSWDDAVAYALWLMQTTGQPWRLPTEAEWEKAARWDPRTGVARLYPWGDTFEAARANTRESGRGGTTAVGAYPSGASSYGADDMAGNVWEWTHSLHKPYPYTVSDGREVDNSTENRVLRGGSWGSVSRNARAAYRFYDRPDLLGDYIGFRLVLAAGSAQSGQ